MVGWNLMMPMWLMIGSWGLCVDLLDSFFFGCAWKRRLPKEFINQTVLRMQKRRERKKSKMIQMNCLIDMILMMI